MIYKDTYDCEHDVEYESGILETNELKLPRQSRCAYLRYTPPKFRVYKYTTLSFERLNRAVHQSGG